MKIKEFYQFKLFGRKVDFYPREWFGPQGYCEAWNSFIVGPFEIWFDA